MSERKNRLYWSFNLPLQVWPEHEDDDENKPIVGCRILNYMPRKERCVLLNLEEVLGEEQTREEFFEDAARHLENLARLFREAKNNPAATVYYHDEGMEDS